MIARLASRRALQSILRQPRSGVRSYHPPADHKQVTIDDMPKFIGPWEEHFNKRQAKFNIHLAVGFSFFVVSLVTAASLGTLDYVDTPPLKN
uniref:Deltamethrin resistance protein prag01 domain-containing protein n=2 Tax=Amblyomma TaxID=6942 RepID=G3MPL4_AMBMU